MSDEECPHFGRPLEFPGECTICSGADAKLQAEQRQARREFHTRFTGFCPECRSTIHVGDLISWAEGELVLHAECAR